MKASTTPSKGYPGYGYLWWLGKDGVFAASGIFGQAIRIDPAARIVIAMHSARPDADKDSDWALQAAMFQAITEALREPGAL
jgi:CubicO group peptidase (beta-lactamase class C family)